MKASKAAIRTSHAVEEMNERLTQVEKNLAILAEKIDNLVDALRSRKSVVGTGPTAKSGVRKERS